jgi:hypothetical protein
VGAGYICLLDGTNDNAAVGSSRRASCQLACAFVIAVAGCSASQPISVGGTGGSGGRDATMGTGGQRAPVSDAATSGDVPVGSGGALGQGGSRGAGGAGAGGAATGGGVGFDGGIGAAGHSGVSTDGSAVDAPADVAVEARPDAIDATVSFPGCDPAAHNCGGTLTCAVNCSARQGQCVQGGTGAPGASCNLNGNADCQPGTQCFTYAGPTCTVSTCLKFCNTDGDCAGLGDGGVCRGAVVCPGADASSTVTSYHTCTFGCDPRAAATRGCPTGLQCLAADGTDQIDCRCTEPTRLGAEGSSCQLNSACAPGLLCSKSSARCQKICALSQGNAGCTTGQICTAIPTDTIYGVCLP